MARKESSFDTSTWWGSQATLGSSQSRAKDYESSLFTQGSDETNDVQFQIGMWQIVWRKAG